MPDGPDFAIFVLLSVPGIFGVWFWSSFSPSPKLSADDRLLRLIILSLISYSILGVLSVIGVTYLDPSHLFASTQSLEEAFSWKALKIVFFASLVSLVISALCVKQSEYEIVHKIARKIKFSYKHGYSSHWDTMVHGPVKCNWVSIKFDEENQFVGYIDSFSECTSERSVTLATVGKIDPDTGELDMWPEKHLMWIPDLSKVESIRISIDHGKEDNGRNEQVEPIVISAELFE